jgi:hypothetical protein
MKKILFVFAAVWICLTSLSQAQTSLQVIHNAPDPSASAVSVWTGVQLPNDDGSTAIRFSPAVPSLPFRGATPRLTALPNASALTVPISINITPTSNAGPTPAVLSLSNLSLPAGNNIAIARGVLDRSRFQPNPNQISTNFGVRLLTLDNSVVASNSVRLLIYHGSPDAPRVEIVVRELGSMPVATLSYDDWAVATVPVGNYTIDIIPVGARTAVASFAAPLANFGGRNVTVAASGFVTPGANVAGGPSFGLLAVVNDAVGAAINLPAAGALPARAATLQFYNSSADTSLSNASRGTSFWVAPPAPLGTNLNLEPAFTRFAYVRTNTQGFRTVSAGNSSVAGLTVPSLLGIPLSINATRDTNQFAAPFLSQNAVRLGIGDNVAIARGVVMPINYAPNPEGKSTAFGVRYFSFRDTSAIASGQTQLVLYHASTDAPRVDIMVRETGMVLATLGYDESVVLTVPTSNYTIDVLPVGSGRIFASYTLPLSTWGLSGSRLVVVANGFLDNGPANRRGPAFGFHSFTTGLGTSRTWLLPSTATPNAVGTSFQALHLSADPANASVGLWVSASGLLATRLAATLNYGGSTAGITDLSQPNSSLATLIGVPQSVIITSPLGTPANSIATFSGIRLGVGANIGIARGVGTPATFAPNPEGRSTAFGLRLLADRDTATIASNQTRLVVYHGATDAPRVSVFVRQNGALLTTLSYDESANATVPTADYIIDVRDAVSNAAIASYRLPLSTFNLGGKRLIVAATGFVTPSRNNNGPAFALRGISNETIPAPLNFILPLVLSTGNAANTQDQEGAVQLTQAAMSGTGVALLQQPSPNPASDEVALQYEVREAGNVQVSLVNALGQEVFSTARTFNAQGVHSLRVDVKNIPAGAYTVRVAHDNGMATTKLTVTK